MKLKEVLLVVVFMAGCNHAQTKSSVSDVEAEMTADNCLDGQDMKSEDVDITKCPRIPNFPQPAGLNSDSENSVSLGAWEIGTTKDGQVYKYGNITFDENNEAFLNYEEEDGTAVTVAVNQGNVDCWAKGYYRLRKILQNPPAEYLALHKAGFQVRFFQFQTDLRNGNTGFKKISSYRDHLVKWVTVIDQNGKCNQTTLQQFTDYAKSELDRRGLALPPAE